MVQNISYLQQVNRDTLWHEHFTTDSALLSWRNYFHADTTTLYDYNFANLSHDTTNGGRLKVALVKNAMEPTNHIGLVSFNHDNLQVGKRYKVSFVADITQLPENDRHLSIAYWTDSTLSMGIAVPPISIDSVTYSGDTITGEFIAPSSAMRIAIMANTVDNGEGYYYLDDYSLREGWVTRMNCDPSNLADNPDGRKYRYGFNGKENDNEVKGEGNHQDYGLRAYDPRIARLNFAVDPLTKSYPELTPYQFASNTPIQAVDLDGGEAKVVVTEIYTNAPTFKGRVNGKDIYEYTHSTTVHTYTISDKELFKEYGGNQEKYGRHGTLNVTVYRSHQEGGLETKEREVQYESTLTDKLNNFNDAFKENVIDRINKIKPHTVGFVNEVEVSAGASNGVFGAEGAITVENKVYFANKKTFETATNLIGSVESGMVYGSTGFNPFSANGSLCFFISNEENQNSNGKLFSNIFSINLYNFKIEYSVSKDGAKEFKIGIMAKPELKIKLTEKASYGINLFNNK